MSNNKTHHFHCVSYLSCIGSDFKSDRKWSAVHTSGQCRNIQHETFWLDSQSPWKSSEGPRTAKVWVSSKALLSLSFSYFLADALGWRWLNFSQKPTLSCFRSAFPSRFPSVTLRKRLQNWTPCLAMESRKAPWSWLHSQCGNAHPLLLLPPPSLSPQSVDHPETGSSLFVFLKKGPCCFSFPHKVNMHHRSSTQTDSFSISSPSLLVREHK